MVDSNARQEQIGEIELREIDSQGPKVTENLIKYLCDNFRVEKLTVSKSTSQFDRVLQLRGLLEFKIVNNDIFSAAGLTFQSFNSLVILEILECKMISLYNITQFIIKSSTIQKLTIVDCITDERNYYLIEYIQTVFSEKSGLTSLHLKASKSENVTTSGFFQLNVNSDCKLRELTLVNNNFLLYIVQNILNNAPDLEELDLRGIKLQQNLNLSVLPELRKLTIDYFYDFTKIIQTII